MSTAGDDIAEINLTVVGQHYALGGNDIIYVLNRAQSIPNGIIIDGGSGIDTLDFSSRMSSSSCTGWIEFSSYGDYFTLRSYSGSRANVYGIEKIIGQHNAVNYAYLNTLTYAIDFTDGNLNDVIRVSKYGGTYRGGAGNDSIVDYGSDAAVAGWRQRPRRLYHPRLRRQRCDHGLLDCRLSRSAADGLHESGCDPQYRVGLQW